MFNELNRKMSEKAVKAIMDKKSKGQKLVHCDWCGKEGSSKRELSILNLAFYVIVGVAAFLISGKSTWTLTLPFILTFVNIKFFVKPRCRYCHSLRITEIQNIEVTDITDAEIINVDEITPLTEEVEELKEV